MNGKAVTNGTKRVSRPGLALAVGCLLGSGPLVAQEGDMASHERGRTIVEARAGAAFPVGELADIADLGPSFGGGVAYFVHPNIALAGDVQVSLLGASGEDPFGVVRTTGVDLAHFGAGILLDFPRPAFQEVPLTFRVRLLNGFTAMSASDVGLDFSETYYTLNGGARVGYRISPRVELFVGSDVYVVLTDSADTVAFFRGPNPVEPMDVALSIPITLGVKAALR